MPLAKPKVLVLDDDPLALELYSRELGSHYQVIACSSVGDTRLALEQGPVDALIIEPAVDEGEGWALLQEFRASDSLPAIILCSVEDERGMGLRQGADAFLVKPVLPVTLHNQLDQILARKAFHSDSRLERGS